MQAMNARAPAARTRRPGIACVSSTSSPSSSSPSHAGGAANSRRAGSAARAKNCRGPRAGAGLRITPPPHQQEPCHDESPHLPSLRRAGQRVRCRLRAVRRRPRPAPRAAPAEPRGASAQRQAGASASAAAHPLAGSSRLALTSPTQRSSREPHEHHQHVQPSCSDPGPRRLAAAGAQHPAARCLAGAIVAGTFALLARPGTAGGARRRRLTSGSHMTLGLATPRPTTSSTASSSGARSSLVRPSRMSSRADPRRRPPAHARMRCDHRSTTLMLVSSRGRYG